MRGTSHPLSLFAPIRLLSVSSRSLHFMFYNYVKRHQTLRTTPAFKAGLADRVWSTVDLAELVERYDYVKLAA
jgi:hypothetical protein